MTINEIYEDCGFNNPDVLVVTEKLLSFLKKPKVTKNSDNEIVITEKNSIFIIDNCADIQKIKTKDDVLDTYDVFYFSDELDFSKIVKK
jgi:hypothetical protein